MEIKTAEILYMLMKDIRKKSKSPVPVDLMIIIMIKG